MLSKYRYCLPRLGDERSGGGIICKNRTTFPYLRGKAFGTPLCR